LIQVLKKQLQQSRRRLMPGEFIFKPRTGALGDPVVRVTHAGVTTRKAVTLGRLRRGERTDAAVTVNTGVAGDEAPRGCVCAAGISKLGACVGNWA